MNYTLDRSIKGIVKAVIAFDSLEWKKMVDDSFEKNKGKYTVQGFRKGKAPKAMIESQYGENTFTQTALDEAFDEAYHKVIDENADIQPIDSPAVALDKFDVDKEIVVTVEIPVLPEFVPGIYAGLTFEKTKVEATDAQIQEQIDRNLLRGSKLIESNSAAEEGDTVVIDFDGYVAGEPFAGGKADNYQLKLGSHSFIDTFEDQLVGLCKGEAKEVNVTFPTEYHEASLAGKPAMFKVTIKNVRKREMPKFDDEFVKSTSEFDTVQAYKENIKAIILTEQTEKADRDLENKMIDAIVDGTDLEVPERVITREQDRMVNGLSNQLSQQGLRLEDYLKYMNKTMEEFAAEQKKYAQKNAKAKYVLEKIIVTEKLDVTEDDMSTKLEEIAASQGTDVEGLKKTLGQQNYTNIINNILMAKLFAHLRATNTIKE